MRLMGIITIMPQAKYEEYTLSIRRRFRRIQTTLSRAVPGVVKACWTQTSLLPP
jgi:hypothetical protein